MGKMAAPGASSKEEQVKTRTERSLVDATEYWQDIFGRSASLINVVCEEWKQDPLCVDGDLPFTAVRAVGEGERAALIQMFGELVDGAIDALSEKIDEEGNLGYDDIFPLIMGRVFLAFSAGYRHAVEEMIGG